jgi:hypothetical protein
MSDAYEGTAFEPISLENAAKPMRPGTLSFQDVSRTARTDEREDVHVAAFHEPGGNLSATAVNEV